MRKKGKILLWPQYFESTISRSKHRRLPKKLTLRGVRLEEIVKASEALGLHPEVVPNAAHPSQNWIRTGSIFVEKTRSKSQLLRLIAEKMQENRL